MPDRIRSMLGQAWPAFLDRLAAILALGWPALLDRAFAILGLAGFAAFLAILVYYVPDPALIAVCVLCLGLAAYDFRNTAFRSQ